MTDHPTEVFQLPAGSFHYRCACGRHQMGYQEEWIARGALAEHVEDCDAYLASLGKSLADELIEHGYMPEDGDDKTFRTDHAIVARPSNIHVDLILVVNQLSQESKNLRNEVVALKRALRIILREAEAAQVLL